MYHGAAETSSQEGYASGPQTCGVWSTHGPWQNSKEKGQYQYSLLFTAYHETQTFEKISSQGGGHKWAPHQSPVY